MEIKINNGFDVCIRLKEIPNNKTEYNPEMGSSDENVSEEEETEGDDAVKTIYYYEHRTKNLTKENLI